VKKTILYLFPNQFTEFHFYKYEICKLEKEYNLKILIHDMSGIILDKNFNSEWKTKLYKKANQFTSLILWVRNFNKLKKKNIIIFNLINTFNFKSLIINLFVKSSNLPVISYVPNSSFSLKKKNISFFLSRIKQHRLNYKIYIFPLKVYFSKFIDSLFKYKNIFLLSNNFDKKKNAGLKAKKSFEIDFHTYDYSNALLTENNNKNYSKNYIIYLDNGAPYFTGDIKLRGERLFNHDKKKHYENLNKFFDSLEKFFKAIVIVIPHPKYKSKKKSIKSLNPYFNNREVNNDYDSLGELSSKCLFFISTYSTAISYAVFHNKPIMNIFSSQYQHTREDIEGILLQSKILGHKPIDICNFSKKEILKNIKVKKLNFKKYKYKYLTPKNKHIEKKPNYRIIGDLLTKEFING